MKKIICKLFGHKDIRVMTTTYFIDENGYIETIIGDDSNSDRMYINGHEIYHEKGNRCSRCMKEIN